MELKVLLFCAVIASMLVGSQAWWDTGHMLVSQIAWKHLNAEGSATPETLHALNNAVNSLVSYSEASNTFVTAACWMDDIKQRQLRMYDNWHFINLPICQFPNSTTDAECNGVSIGSVFAAGGDAYWAINQAISTLRSKSALGFERGFALRNLLHIVGDIHQPLHAVARFAPETPNGDLGGNLFYVRGVNGTSNLHGFWDSGVGMLNNAIQRPLNQSSLDYISNLADELIEKSANLTTNVTSYNVSEWIMESRELAITYVYNLTYNSVPSEYYISQSWEVVQEQLALAGHRLHLLLKEIEPCNETGNCPEQPAPITERDTNWFIAGIVLAVALALSLLFNILQYARGRNSKYQTI